MKGLDFTFRDETLSSYGYMICEFNSLSGATTITTDSQKSFSSIQMYGGKYHPIIYHTYDNTLIIEMDICKLENSENKIISPAESATIKRWLGSPYACKLTIDNDDLSGYFWNGSFNVEEIHYALGHIGFHLTFTSTAPFGYKDMVNYSGYVAQNGSIIITDTSDEEGYIYPDIEITLAASGNLKITNQFDKRVCIINNCSSGETITMTHLLQILSSKKSHNLGDDFNYKFIRINNEFKNVDNELTFNLPCNYTIKYNPIAKVVVS